MSSAIANRVWLLVAGTVTAAVVAMAASWRGPVTSELWFWLAVCIAGERLWVRLPAGEATASMASCFHFAAALILPPGQAMFVAALGSAVGERIFQRKPLIRVTFNAAQAGLAVGAASWCLGIHGGSALASLAPPVLQPLRLLAAAAAYFVINKGAVTWAVALHEGISLRQSWRANFGSRYELMVSGAQCSLGALLANYYAGSGIAGTVLVILPILAAFEGYRHTIRRRAAPASATTP